MIERLKRFLQRIYPKIIFESDDYYQAIYEVQAELRNQMKWSELSEDTYNAYDKIADMICEELNERKLRHYWSSE